MRTKQTTITAGMLVIRKRDGAPGRVLHVGDLFSRGSRFPFKTIVTLRLDDEELAKASGGDQSGDLGWFRSYFKTPKAPKV